jgi:hypothetical protein
VRTALLTYFTSMNHYSPTIIMIHIFYKHFYIASVGCTRSVDDCQAAAHHPAQPPDKRTTTYSPPRTVCYPPPSPLLSYPRTPNKKTAMMTRLWRFPVPHLPSSMALRTTGVYSAGGFVSPPTPPLFLHPLPSLLSLTNPSFH